MSQTAPVASVATRLCEIALLGYSSRFALEEATALEVEFAGENFSGK